jgi:hypothetical protein
VSLTHPVVELTLLGRAHLDKHHTDKPLMSLNLWSTPWKAIRKRCWAILPHMEAEGK